MIFSELFVGRDDCYGSYKTPSGSSPNGEKLEGRARTLREPVTQELYDAHNAGEDSLGIVPIRPDGTVMWFAIDVDTYDDEKLHKKLLKKIYKHNLSLVMTKSKSGGAHLWCFFTSPATAKEARDTAKIYLKKLGLPMGTEIFPKQDRVSEKDVGSWINLPFFGDTRHQVVWDPSVDETLDKDLEWFLEIANEIAVDPLDLAYIPEVKETTDESDAPPCIDTMEKNKVQEGGRDDALFHVASYMKKAYPDDWEAKVGQWNADYCEPPLPFGDVMRITSQNEKTDFGYGCNKAPMCTVCEKPLCLTRKFGIGSGLTGEELGFHIDNIKKIDSDIPVYWVSIDGSKEIKMGSDDLLTYSRFKSAVFAKLNRVLPVVTKSQWEPYLDGLMGQVIPIKAPEMTGEAGIILYIMTDWLEQQSQDMRMSDANTGIPYYKDGKAYFRASDLIMRVRHSYPQAKLQDIWSILEKNSAEEHHVGEGKDRYSLWMYPCPDLKVRKMGSGF